MDIRNFRKKKYKIQIIIEQTGMSFLLKLLAGRAFLAVHNINIIIDKIFSGSLKNYQTYNIVIPAKA